MQNTCFSCLITPSLDLVGMNAQGHAQIEFLGRACITGQYLDSITLYNFSKFRVSVEGEVPPFVLPVNIESAGESLVLIKI